MIARDAQVSRKRSSVLQSILDVLRSDGTEDDTSLASNQVQPSQTSNPTPSPTSSVVKTSSDVSRSPFSHPEKSAEAEDLEWDGKMDPELKVRLSPSQSWLRKC